MLEKPVSFPAGVILTFKLVQKHGGWNSDDNQNLNLGRFRFSVTDRPDAVADLVPRGVREILAVPREQRTAAQVNAVFSYWRTTRPEWKAANDQIEALWKQHPEGSSQLVLQDREQPRQTHQLQRGDFLKPGKVVTAGTPAFLNPPPAEQPATRLTFAQWLVDRQAPTTARAIVNRVWQAYFGTGIVSTSEDLGSQCEAPSHPELLDWLAVELMESGWSLKHLHRLIVTSATYRQSSRVTPELYAKDPYNRLLARGPRFRVDAEVVRDIALAASGLLNPSIGGESVYPPAPAFLFQPPASYGPKTWVDGQGSRPLPPRSLHFPVPFGSLPDAPKLRRAQRRLLLRSPRPLEHAAPGPDPAQRAGRPRMRPSSRPADVAERRIHRRRTAELCVPPLPGPASRGRRVRTAHGVAPARDPALRHRGRQPVGPGRRQARRSTAATPRHDTGPACRVDRRCTGFAKSR